MERLRSQIKGDILLPTDEGYAEAIKRWSVLAERKASVVICPKDEHDVVLAIGHARTQGLELAVKGGGHNPSPAASTERGLVIDLSRYLTRVDVDVDQRITKVQGGARWEDVNRATCPLGYAAVGAIVDHVGVGGLTLGGGPGYMTGRHGLAIDNLLAATVVTADGRALQASKELNEDLFFGIRGGGVNFGIVTSFTFAIHPIPPVCWSGLLTFPANTAKVKELFDTADKWIRGEQTADDTALIRFIKRDVILVLVAHLGPAITGKQHFKAFYDLGPVGDMTRELSYADMNKQINPAVPPGKAYFLSGTTVARPIASAAESVFAAHAKMLDEMPCIKPMVGYELFHLGKLNSVPNDAMAFAGRGSHINVMINLSWDPDAVDVDMAEVRRRVKEMKGLIRSEEPSTERETFYGNYETDGVTDADRVRQLYGDNLPKLQAIKAKYDPELVFAKWFPIQPQALFSE